MASQHFEEYTYPPESNEYPPHGYDPPYVDGPIEYEMDPPSRTKSKGKGEKRTAARMVSDGADEFNIPPPPSKHATKKRKLDGGVLDIIDDGGHPMENVLQPIPPSVKIVKGKVVPYQQREGSYDTISTPAKPSRKRPGPKKKAPELMQGIQGVSSVPPSVAGDVTPSISRAGSPGPVNTGVIFELDEVIPPLKRAKKMDDPTMLKRVKALEDAQRKVWTNIARRDVVKVGSDFVHSSSNPLTRFHLGV